MAYINLHRKILCDRSYDELPPIEVVKEEKHFIKQLNVFEAEIVFLWEGTLSIVVDSFPERFLTKGRAVLLLPGTRYILRSSAAISLIIFRMNSYFMSYESFLNTIPFDSLIPTDPLPTLPLREPLSSFLSGLKKNEEEETDHSLLTERFIVILRMHYETEELVSFFNILRNPKYNFATFIYNNFRKIKTVEELASLYCTSISPFYRKFRRTFGTSAYQWMMRKRNQKLLFELQYTNKVFKLLADELQFSSLSQFCDYCKKHFGMPPGKIRKKALWTQVQELN